MQESVLLRTSRIAQIRLTLNSQGGQTLLKIWNAALPVNCGAADPGAGLIGTINLPSIPFSEANGVATMSGTWQTVASGTGLARFYRMYDSTGVCHIQGYCSEVWGVSTTYQLNQQVSNVNGLYINTQAGVSASVGVGPSGTGVGIVDGSCQWSFLAPAAEIVLGSTVVGAGLSLTVQGFTVTAANA